MRLLLRLVVLVVVAGLAWRYLVQGGTLAALLPEPFASLARWLLLAALGLALLVWLVRTALWLVREVREALD